MDYLWLGKSLPDAIAAPTLYVDGGTVIKPEPGFNEVHNDNKNIQTVVQSEVSPLLRLIFFVRSLQDVLQALVAMGHERGEANRFFNVVNAVSKKNGCICAVSDARKMGQVAGY